VVHFRVSLLDSGFCLLLNDEAHLSGDTEVAHCNENNFLEHSVLAKLMRGVTAVLFFFILWQSFEQWKLITAHQAEMHDISYIKVEDPVILLLETKVIAN